MSAYFTLGGLVGIGSTLESGVYQTLAGATVKEVGDRVTNGSRVMPLTAILTFDVNVGEPSLTALITNAVLEGGDPFKEWTLLTNAVAIAEGRFAVRLERTGAQRFFRLREQ